MTAMGGWSGRENGAGMSAAQGLGGLEVQTLAEALLPLLQQGGGVIAAVGGGGKTSALFRLASSFAQAGRKVLLTSTTHMLDPRLEQRPALSLLLRPDLRGFPGEGPLPEARPGITMLMAGPAEHSWKLQGIHPGWIPVLRPMWDFILVEADGSRGLPVKAPAAHEPVLPSGTDLVLGVLGLDGLGRPMDSKSVHRLDPFSALTGCLPGAPITWAHVGILAAHPEGLFKGAGTCRRVMLLNKWDQAPVPSDVLPWPAVDRVVVGSLEPSEGVIVIQRGTP